MSQEPAPTGIPSERGALRLGSDEERGLVALATRRPVGVTMLALTVVLFGWISLGLLPRNLMPDISYPSVTVRTEYPGAAPIEVESRISRRLEEVLSQVRNLRRISSVSRSEVSDVILEFAWETDMGQATTEVREKVSQVFLPDGVEPPTFLRYDPSLDPILQMGLTMGGDSDAAATGTLIDLRLFAEDELEQALESIAGVAGVRVRGGLEKEVRIDVDEDALHASGIDVELVARRVADENLNQASGILYEGNQSRAVRTVNEFVDLEEIRDIVLRREGSVPVLLRDVAQVSFGYEDPEVITRIDGRPCVKIDIYKEADANVVEVAERVKARVFGRPHEQAQLAAWQAQEARGETDSKEDGGAGEASKDDAGAGGGASAPPRVEKPTFLAARLPESVELHVMSDQSVFIQAALDDVRSTATSGGVLAVLVLFVFLRSVWFTFAVGLSIPLSIMAAFIAMHLSGVSLNMMSLGGLALGIGMLVDNSIVVLESIFRCREEGDGPRHAAIRGTNLVSGAVTASTLTTVAVFFPIVFVEGVAGQMFRDQALTVVISLVASLVAALYFIPAMVARQPTGAGVRRSGRSSVIRALRGRGWFATWRTFGSGVSALPWNAWSWIGLAPWTGLVLFPLALLEFVLAVVSRLVALALAFVLGVLRVAWSATGFLRRGVGGGVLGFFDRAFESARTVYGRLLSLALAHRGIVVVLVSIVSVLIFRQASTLETELIPQVHQGEFTVDVRLPRATRIEETDRVIRPWEKAILVGTEFASIASLTTTIGAEKDELTQRDEGEHSARLLVRVAPSAGDREGVAGRAAGGQDLRAVEETVKDRFRALLRDAEFESLEITHPVLFSFKTPIEVEISGYDLSELGRVSSRVEAELAEIPELEDVRSSLAPGDPEIPLRLDRDLLSRFQLDHRQIGTLVRDKIQGNVSTYFTMGDRKVPIRVRLEEEDRDSLANLSTLVVHRTESGELRLRDVIARPDAAETSVVSLPIGEGPAEIRRIDHQRAAVITANLAGASLGKATEAIERVIRDTKHPADFAVGFGGQKEEMDRALDSLVMALLLAVFLVYVVMAMQFESLVQPLVIIVSIPLALLGTIPVLAWLGIPLSIVVFIGTIVLAGIVVNNAIVLIDTANQWRRAGLPMSEALVEAGKLRLRPIFMTTGTTVLGLLPLTGALSRIPGLDSLFGAGQGEEIRAPLAITVVSGLIASTLLTLVIIPVVASIVDSVIGFFRAGPAGEVATDGR